MSSSSSLRLVRENWKAGLNVALISIPLSLSLAIASGARPIMGIITAIWAGLAAAVFSGSRFNVIGPAGALSGILTAYALSFGVESLPMLAILTGILILICYALKWDKYIVFIPSAVVHGFTLGVAFIIGLGQLNAALGLPKLPAHDTLIRNVVESLSSIGQTDPTSFSLFLLCFIALFLLAKFVPRVPGPVIVAIIGITIGYAANVGWIHLNIATLFDKYGTFKAELIAIPHFELPAINTKFLSAVLTTAIVAMLETLLSAKIADSMARAEKPFDQRKEMFGLGVANVLSGLVGGLPATGVLARTALNIKSGATSKVASGLNALFVLVLSFFLFQGFQYLPLAVVASILMYVAIRMIGLEHYRNLFTMDKTMFFLSIIVAALTVVVDPLVGILAGSTVAMLLFLQQLSKGQSEVTIHRDKRMVARVPQTKLKELEDHGDITVYRFAGELTYFNGIAHASTIRSLRGCHTIILSLRNLFYIDIDGVETLADIIKEAKSRERKVILTGVGESIAPMLSKVRWYREKMQNGSVFGSTTDALTALGFPLTKAGK